MASPPPRAGSTGFFANLDPTLAPGPYPGLRNFHVMTDLQTVFTFWAMERRRRKLALPLPIG
jgi:hypothetical protein